MVMMMMMISVLLITEKLFKCFFLRSINNMKNFSEVGLSLINKKSPKLDESDGGIVGRRLGKGVKLL